MTPERRATAPGSPDFARAIDDFCATEFAFHPVDASFAGAAAYDGALPDPASDSRERASLRRFLARLDATTVPDSAGARLDARLARAHAAHRLRILDERPLAANPAWYAGEAAFGMIALLLRERPERDDDGDADVAALRARVRAIPAFLQAGARALRERPTPRPWVERARAEAAVAAAFVRDDLPRHPLGARVADDDRARASVAFDAFATAIATLPDASPACGRDHLAFLMTEVHGLADTPESLEARAIDAFAEARDAVERAATTYGGDPDWRALLESPPPDDVAEADAPEIYRTWHERAMRDAAELVTPAAAYDLAFRPLPAWARASAAGLYFLSYRSPAPLRPGTGSTYWTAPGTTSRSAIKMIHAVHHGSIGHHTQNARARVAESRLARLAGTDAASGIAMLAAGTLVEGWACYVETLLLDAPDFYTPYERFLIAYNRVRNVASVLVDVRLHVGTWSLEEARRFYREEAAFPAARVASETTRNSIFPGSRLMYWTGVEAIERLRRAYAGSANAFHDRLLAVGAAPVAWIGEELAR